MTTEGHTGPPGETGETGETGATGTPGATGASGATGAAGARGHLGTTGKRGPVGPQGPEGGGTPALTATLAELARSIDRLGTRSLVNLVTTACIALVGALLVVGIVQIKDIGRGNRSNGDLLVDCVTPTPGPTPEDPTPKMHVCWDRLHDPKATGDAVAVIVDDLYCDQRRAQAKLPAVPDPTKLCRAQTPAAIYPGLP